MLPRGVVRQPACSALRIVDAVLPDRASPGSSDACSLLHIIATAPPRCGSTDGVSHMIIDREDARLKVICAECGEQMRRVGLHLATGSPSRSILTYECDCGEMVTVGDNERTREHWQDH